LRCIEAAWIDGRAFHVVDLPTGKMGAGDIPLLALAIGCQNESAFACADQNADAAHRYLLVEFLETGKEPRFLLRKVNWIAGKFYLLATLSAIEGFLRPPGRVAGTFVQVSPACRRSKGEGRL
jgi:hypothetical protein